MKHILTITGMSCGHCSARVQKALEEVPGVRGAEVDLTLGIATVEADDSVTPEHLRSAVEDAGYDVAS